MLHDQRHHRIVAFGFAALAGYVDAIGFLSSGGLFVSFMSGNSTRLAIGVTQAAHLGLVAAGLIALFVLGVVLAALLAEAVPPHRRKLLAAVLVAALLVVAATLQTLDTVAAMLAVLAVAMGASNTVLARDNDVAIGVTYMTGTLVKLGLRIVAALRGGERFGWWPYLLLWLALVAGGAAGAVGFQWSADASLWGAAAFACLLAGAVGLIERASPA